MTKLNPKLLANDLLADCEDRTELRYQNNAVRRFSLTAGQVRYNARSDERGVSARVLRNGVAGFAASPLEDPETVRRVLREAEQNARIIGRYGAAVTDLRPSGPAYSRELQDDYEDLEQSYYGEVARKLDAYILKNCPKIKDRVVSIYSDTVEKILLVSQDCRAHLRTPRSYAYITLMADSNKGDTVEVFEAIGGYGDLRQALPDLEAAYRLIDQMYQQVLDKAQGVSAKAGVHNCILGGTLAGMLAHEAVGHTVESDLVLGGSVAARLMDQQVASPLINLTDFAHTALGQTAPLPVYVDDEGTPAEDVEIIKDGILRSYMHNLETADHFGVRPQGNARAWLYSDEPLIRMRNTAILPGKDKLEDMIADTEEGYYLISTNNGQADNTGEFMFGISMAYEIKNGKLGRAVRDTTISGVAFEMLKTVDRVGDQIAWESNGFCGKKQPMAVGLGGPALRCRLMMGGE